MPTVTTNTVYAELPDTIGQQTPVIVHDWRVGEGSRPTEVTLEFPTTAVAGNAWEEQLAVNLYRGTTPVFRGHTVDSFGSLTAQDNTLILRALDIRYAMAARQVGQYGVGPIATSGGWPGIGYELVFNRDGRPNRSATATAGVYTFDTTSAAQYWTYTQILQFLFKWYVPETTCTINAGALGGPLDSTAGEFVATIGTVPKVLDRITRSLGGSWTITHLNSLGDTLGSLFTPIFAGIAAQQTHTLHLDDANHRGTPSVLSVGAINVRRSTRRSWDTVQVVSGSTIVESTYATIWGDLDNGLAPPVNLTRVTSGKEIPSDCAMYFTPDVTAYSTADLGSDLPAGSPPKRWRDRLVTRRDTSGYVAANNPTLGSEIDARECVWLSVDAGATWRRLVKGFKIDPYLARVYLQPKVAYYNPTGSASLAWDLSNYSAANIHLAITIPTVLELPEVSGTTSTYLTNPRVRRIHRLDLTPLWRSYTILPDLASANPNAITVATSTLTEYLDITDQLDAVRDQLKASRQAAEITASIQLPFAPDINLGDAVQLSPATDHNVGTLRVVSIEFQARTLDVAITATNNLDRS